ncbi:MAG: hypothetical protein A2X58_14315 [Nitrospirae bacterium GWC2_56_14]|nr:MAG: hypothetical protein A2X58_14315 [Nitrospirae bacterium GWC2_56_14]
MMAQVEPTAHFKPEQRGYEEGKKTAGMRKRKLINFDGLVKSLFCRHCEERSDAAISFFWRLRTARLLRFARKDGLKDFIRTHQF